MEKNYRRCRYLVFLWIVYVAFDSASTLFRSLIDSKSNTTLNTFFRGASLARSLIVFLIAFLNYILIFRKSCEK